MGVEILVVGAVVGLAGVWAGPRAGRALNPPPPRPGAHPCSGCTSCPDQVGDPTLTNCKSSLDFE